MLELFWKTNNLLDKDQHISKVNKSEIFWYIHRNRSLFLLRLGLEASFIKTLIHYFLFGQIAVCMVYRSEWGGRSQLLGASESKRVTDAVKETRKVNGTESQECGKAGHLQRVGQQEPLWKRDTEPWRPENFIGLFGIEGPATAKASR